MDTFKFENVWAEKHLYDEAERKYYEKLYSGASSTSSRKPADAVSCQKTVDQSSKQTDTVSSQTIVTKETEFQKKVTQIEGFIKDLKKEFQEVRDLVSKYDSRLKSLESGINRHISVPSSVQNTASTSSQKVDDDDADDGVDLFGSDSEDEDAEAKRIKEQRLAEYAAKKSKKPTLIAKSNIILDVKPWDDETDMKELEKAVRNVAMDGLVWGASKLVPLAYGIHKLQISCVVEDEKVSVDLLQEQIQEIEDYVQSVDIAAFNKV